MKEGVLKEEYRVPRMEVREVVLESIIALDSYKPSIAAGDIKYNEYDEVPELIDNSGKDIAVF
jgi:hypothetical protein